MNFKVGDIVKVINSGLNGYNMIGRVVKVYTDGKKVTGVGVELKERPQSGHNCGGYAKDKHGWNYTPDSLEYVEDVRV